MLTCCVHSIDNNIHVRGYGACNDIYASYNIQYASSKCIRTKDKLQCEQVLDKALTRAMAYCVTV